MGFSLFCLWLLLRFICGCGDCRGFGTGFFPLLHSFWITRPQNTFFFWRAVKLRMEIETAFKLGLLLFDGNAMGIGPSVLPDAGHLPGNLHVGFVRLDAES